MPVPQALPHALLFSVRQEVRGQDRVDVVAHLGFCALVETLSGPFIEPLLRISIPVVDPGNHFVEFVIHRDLLNQYVVTQFLLLQ